MTFPRKPMDLPMQRLDGCVTNMVGQVLYVFGSVDRPDLPAIEQAVGCRENEAMTDMDAYAFLLNNGFGICEITTYNADAFLHHGVTYLRQVYKTAWDAHHDEHEAYYNPRAIADMQYRTARYLDVVRRQPRGAYTRMHRNATQSDVHAALERKCVVDVTTSGRNGLTVHSQLLTPPTGARETGWLYDPKFTAETVSPLKLKDLWPEVLVGHGVTVIWPR